MKKKDKRAKRAKAKARENRIKRNAPKAVPKREPVRRGKISVRPATPEQIEDRKARGLHAEYIPPTV